MSQVDEAVELYRAYIKHPTVDRARVSNAKTAGHTRVYSEWSQPDLERSERIKIARNHITQLNVVFDTPPTDISTELMNEESHSGKYRAILRTSKDKKGEEKQYLEVWDDSCKLQSVCVTDHEQHGKVYTDSTLSCLEWSNFETHLLYIAEKKEIKPKSFFDKSAAEEEIKTGKSKVLRGDEYVFTDDWGEKLVGKSHPVLCVLDIESGIVSTLDNLPDELSPGQAIWCPDDQGIACVGWYHDPYRLGLVYCPMRRSAIFHIDLKNKTCTCLYDKNSSVRCPSFSPDQTKLVFLENQTGGPHFPCSKLLMIDWSTKGVVQVLDVVRKAPKNEFQGIYSISLPKRCWTTDSNRLVLDTTWRSKNVLIVVQMDTGKVTQLPMGGDYGASSMLDIHQDLVVAGVSSPNQPHFLQIGHLPSVGNESTIKWTLLDGAPIGGSTWTIHPMQAESGDDCTEYEYVLMKPMAPKGDRGKTTHPLAVFIHGGPHSSYHCEFGVYLQGLCSLGYAIQLVNYRGSIGFGQDCIDSLLGKVGTQDVADVQNAVENLLAEDSSLDRNRVVVMGGSHGGFLTAHLIGQFPNFYKAAVARNPVINLASMFTSTDIPDWCCVETGLPFSYDTATPEIYSKMLKASPITYVNEMKTPLMLMIGLKDKRVPPQQSHELRKALLDLGCIVRTLQYPDDRHDLGTVPTQADAFVNIVQWFDEHNPAK